MTYRLALTVLIMTLPVLASAEQRSRGIHVHGQADMDIAALGPALEIELRSPAMNIVGFEHAPGSESEARTLANALATLRDPARVLGLPAEAECSVQEAAARRVSEHEHSQEAHGHDEHADEGNAHDEHGHEDHGHEDHGHEDDGHEEDDHGHDEQAGSDEAVAGARHAEIHAHYRLRCAVPEALDAIEVHLFEQFPATESIRVQLLTATAQSAVTLTADAARVEF